MKKYCISVIVCMMVVGGANAAVNINSSARSWWGYSNATASGNASGFILVGSTGKSGTHGTWGDEWGVIGLVAEKIVEHGGYFCPYQVQCANKKAKKRSWTKYFVPSGLRYDQCVWLCETGYAGVNCAKQDGVPLRYNTSPLNATSSGLFSGLAIKTSGEDSNEKSSSVAAFNEWGDDPKYVSLLGGVKFMEHGIMAAPVMIECGRDNWRKIDSFVKSVSLAGKTKLLCAEGYKADANGTDCIPIVPAQEKVAAQEPQQQEKIEEEKFCSGFPKDGYKAEMHNKVTHGDCIKYFCGDPNKGFESAINTNCIDCSAGLRGGVHTDTGVCVKCSVGMMFDEKTNRCINATAYSKVDMTYGKGHTKLTQTVLERQCWTKTIPSEYRDCVINGGGNTSTTRTVTDTTTE
ncbi:MAG: hypothetical protein IKW57_00385 [Alphaproteobacteria bacterium]|nr:hypothetical protein [Alphaproteobacteria bacterium]